MVREIEFRGKRTDNGKWVYGCLTRYSDTVSYITEDVLRNKVYEVDAQTVGQYTGMRDRKGKKIYEGDIYRFKDYSRDGDPIVEDEIRFNVMNLETYAGEVVAGFIVCEFQKGEVISNIHDNTSWWRWKK